MQRKMLPDRLFVGTTHEGIYKRIGMLDVYFALSPEDNSRAGKVHQEMRNPIPVRGAFQGLRPRLSLGLSNSNLATPSCLPHNDGCTPE
jgi:hypothetical protein